MLAQRVGGEGEPGRSPARGTRTIRMCSFDARIRESTSPLFEEKTSELGGNIDGCVPEMRGLKGPSLDARSGRSVSPPP